MTETTQKKLQTRVVNAGFWSFLLHAGGRLIGFVRTLVIARLLAPDDIGLFAIATISLSLIETFLNPGLQSALVQKKGNISDDLNAAWTIQVLVGIFKAIFLFCLAPFVADFFDVQAVNAFIRTISIAVFIHAFKNIGVVFFRKELNFRRHFAYMLSGTIADLVVAVSAAIYFKTAWALVYGLSARYIVQTFLSFLIHPFRPRIEFNLVIFKKLLNFGIWINLMGAMAFLARDGARIVIGKFVDTNALGLYEVASWITDSALVEMVGVFGVVAFSAYSKIQNDSLALRNAYIRTAGFKISFILPLMAGIILAGDLFISLFLGDQWTGSIQVVKLLAISGCFLAITNTSQPVFMALGKPKLSFYLQMLRAIILMILAIPLTITKGIEGAAMATIFSNLAVLFAGLHLMKKTLALNLADFNKLLAPGLLATIVMAAMIVITRILLKEYYTIYRYESFAALITTGMFSYLIVLKMLETRYPNNRPLQAFSLLAGNGTNKSKTPENA